MFTDEQKKELAKPLNPKNVKPPAPGKYGEYIEGWKVIEEANRIFGHDGWSRETIEMVEVCRYETTVGRDAKPGWAIGYRAKVRVKLYTGEGDYITREGSAVGNGVSVQLYDAIESAVKEAETDAMKRAMMTLGYPFGLALYDKTKEHVGIAAASEPDPMSPIPDKTRDWLQAQIDASLVQVGDVCRAFEVSSLKQLTFGQVREVTEWLKQKKAA